MTLPPERILIKRKFEYEAPETLYLDHERPKRLRHSASDYCFRLVKTTLHPTRPSTGSGFKDGRRNDRAASSHVTSAVPIVRATEPGAELEEERRLQAARLEREQRIRNDQPTDLPEKTPALSQSQSPGRTTGLEPRQFHLTRPSTGNLAYSGEQDIQNPLSTSRASKIALFMERQAGSDRDGQESPSAKVTKMPMPDTEMEDAKVTPRKKRPKANAAERLFLESQKKISDEIAARKSTKPAPEPTLQNTPEIEASSGAPSQRVQQILLDMAREDQGLSDMSELQKALDESTMDVDSDADYVYETYIRVPRSEMIGLHDIAGQMKSFGILVIEEEDQQLWETYAEMEDDEWDVEDEDSNAEDHPANEYPEEEFDSDDEFGYGAYRNRHAASDDEEFDLKDDVWSEDGYGSI